MYYSFMTNIFMTSLFMTSLANGNRPLPTMYLDRPEGRIAYDVRPSEGPPRGLVVAVPGMGDLRSTYRFLAPALAGAGYRVVTTDLRGHGDSSAGFRGYGDEATAGDLIALVESLRRADEPVIVIGNSMAAGSAVIVAASRPDLVQGLVLIGPFVRDGERSFSSRVLFRVAMARPWVSMVWKSYVPSMYAGRRPGDFDQHLRAIVASLRRPGYARAFSRTTRTSHAAAEAALGRVDARTLVVMGRQDPDFADPDAEARWVAQQVRGTARLVDEAGHYPHAQRPDVVTPAVLAFLAERPARPRA